MILKIYKPLLNADDVEMINPDGSVAFMNKILANVLWEPGNDNVIKFYDWGIQLWKTGSITIDRTDVEILRVMIEQNAKWDRFTKGRFLDELQNIK